MILRDLERKAVMLPLSLSYSWTTTLISQGKVIVENGIFIDIPIDIRTQGANLHIGHTRHVDFQIKAAPTSWASVTCSRY